MPAIMRRDNGHVTWVPEGENALFRTAHTIEGSAGLFGLDHTKEAIKLGGVDKIMSPREIPRAILYAAS